MTFRTISKATVVTSAVACMIVGAFVAAYDWHEVRPHLSEIRAALDIFTPEDRNVPSDVAGFIWKLEEKHEINVNAQVAQMIVGKSLPMRAGAWHLHNLMWSLLLPLHFDRQTRMALYCHNIAYENGRGLSDAGEYYFHKPPHELSTSEVAGIIAIDWSPSINSPTRHQDHYAQATKRLLDTYATP